MINRPPYSVNLSSISRSLPAYCSIVLLFLLSVFAAPSAFAQSNYGSLRGLVTDAQGATIAKATVTLTNQATHIARTAISNAAGDYVFTAVDPATYTVSITAGGFKKLNRKGISVDTGNTITVDAKLEVGTAQQTIEVTSAEPLIDNSTASNGQVIDSQKLENLPNPGRNPFLFSKLDNNVTPVGDPRFVRFQDQSGSSQISIDGGPIAGNNYEIDGVPITDFLNRAVIIPSLESTEEVKVQSTTYDAEMGRTGGGMFNTTLKSGTNTYHGVLQGETRQTNWGANSFFNNRNSYFNGSTTLPQTPRGAAEFYSYVGAIGGPIRIPRLYNGTDKTFFWIAEEGYRQRSPLSNSYYVPTALERAGDFSQSNVNIYDPSTPIVNGMRTQFMGLKNGVPTPNVIPTAQLSQVGLNIMKAFPLPNQNVGANVAFGTNNFFGEDTLGDRADEFTGKVDHQFATWWAANASYMHYGSKEPVGDLRGTFPGGATSYLRYRKVDSTEVNSTFTVNPTTIITAGFGFNRFPNNALDLSNGFDQTALGLPSGYVTALQKKAFPKISGQNMAQLGTNNSGPAVFFSRSFVTGISKSMGKHSLKAGYVFRSISVSFENVGVGNGAYSFDSSYTSQNGTTSSTKNKVGGADSASLILGYPSGGAVAVTTPLAVNVHYNAVYFQDDYRVTPKLTFNMGLRYEHEPGARERNNHYAVGFDRSVVNPITAAAGVQTLGGVEFAGVNGYPTICCNNSNLKFAPRFGVAYALRPNTVVRGGFGVFYAPIAYSTDPSLAPGYTQTNSFVAPSATSAAAPTLGNPFPGGLVAPSGNANGYMTGVGSSLYVLDQYRRSPLVDQYSFDIEQELPSGFAFKIGYVGSHGRNLPHRYNLNQLPNAQLAQGAALGSSVANPYYQKGGVGVIGGKTVHQSQLLLPFPEFSTVSIATSVGKSRYNSLDLKLQKRFSKGFTVLAAYTWASNWDNSWGAGSTLNSGDNGPQDIYNLAPEYARAINDMPSRFTITGTYDLPFGHGKQFLGGANRWMNLAVGGWTFNDISILQSGSPLALGQQGTAPSGTFGIGGSVQRPTFTGTGTGCGSGSPEGRIGSYISSSAYTTTPQFQYGNVPRTINCYGPGYVNSDLSLNKTFMIGERVSAQFRAEALNAFNTPEFATPNLTVGNSNFGHITQTLGFPRLIQLGGRLSF